MTCRDLCGRFANTVNDGVPWYITPRRAAFPWPISPQVEIVPVPKRSALETSRRQLSEDRIVRCFDIVLVVEQSSVENRPSGVWHTPSYTVPPPVAFAREKSVETKWSQYQPHETTGVSIRHGMSWNESVSRKETRPTRAQHADIIHTRYRTPRKNNTPPPWETKNFPSLLLLQSTAVGYASTHSDKGCASEISQAFSSPVDSLASNPRTTGLRRLNNREPT